MKGLVLLMALSAGACDRNPSEGAAMPAPAAPDASLSTPAPGSKPAEVVPLPKDQAQLDRMILAGYTPHMDHLHRPGVNECPLTKGTEAVM
jgi:hypothetical protein